MMPERSDAMHIGMKKNDEVPFHFLKPNKNLVVWSKSRKNEVKELWIGF